MKNKQNIAVTVALVTVFTLFGYQYLPEEIGTLIPENTKSALADLSQGNNSYVFPSPQAREAWEVFAEYLEYAKNHNIEGIKSLSYRTSPACEDPTREAECFSLMDNVYALGSEYEAKDFTKIWQDDKQVILATDYSSIDETGQQLRIRIRGLIYFVKDDLGELKILGFNPADGIVIRTGGLEEHEIQERIADTLEDSDGDTLPNQVEFCELPSDIAVACEETNPFLKDSDGNGYWDSIDALMRR